MSAVYNSTEIAAMDRKEMQMMCKSLGIKANTTTDTIRAALVTHFDSVRKIPVAGMAELSDGCQIAYTQYNKGSDTGTPLLLINGWSCPQGMWGTLMTNGLYKTPRFTGGREVIIFDNRGIGLSSSPDGPYSVGGLASDARELLAHLGHKRAHVLGVSLGGMVAQQLAHDCPDAVASLVLCSTTAGGKRMTAASKKFARSFFGSFRGWEDSDSVTQMNSARNFICGVLAPRNRLSNQSSTVERLAKSFLWAGERSLKGINAQLSALSWKGGLELSAIEQPSLVVHGTHDQVLPFPNAETIAAALPQSRLLQLPGHGHLWNVTHESAVRTINQFLLDVDSESLADSYTAETYAPNYL